MNLSTISITTIIAFCVGFVFGFVFNGHRLESKYNAEKVAAYEEKVEKEKALIEVNEALQDQLKKEKANVQKTVNDLKRRINDGELRYTIAVDECTSASVGGGKASAKLNGTFTNALIGIAEDGDNAIRDLNYCIDAYNEVRKAR